MSKWFGVLFLAAASAQPYLASADEIESTAVPSSGKVVYKKGKDIDFEALLIQGQLMRPEMTVVTGDPNQGLDGLLRLRENFWDRMTADSGEEIQ